MLVLVKYFTVFHITLQLVSELIFLLPISSFLFIFQATRAQNENLVNCKFEDLEIITPLGEGGFGLVKLVKVKGIDDRAYALKCIQKTRVVQYGQQRHIMDEKNILSKIQSTFILALHKTFKGRN